MVTFFEVEEQPDSQGHVGFTHVLGEPFTYYSPQTGEMTLGPIGADDPEGDPRFKQSIVWGTGEPCDGAAVTYTLHLVALPHGWVVTQPGGSLLARPEATIGRDGTIGALISRASLQRWRVAGSGTLLVLHPNGRSVMLRSSTIEGPPQFFRKFDPGSCREDTSRCLEFRNVAVADDGTPFVTAAYGFSGAHPGSVEGAFVWNGAWHFVPAEDPFGGLGMPSEPRNVSIAAAASIHYFTYVGDHSDGFPGEDLNVAAHDPKLLDVSAASFHSRTFALGLGNATAMRDWFVAGYDSGQGLVRNGTPRSSTAVVWGCSEAQRSGTRRCRRSNLGRGAAYDVDPLGEAVGGADPDWMRCTKELRAASPPILWRNGKAIDLAAVSGSAYGISQSGTIVGSIGPPCRPGFARGFVADAREAPPQAHPLDDLVSNLDGRHVTAAFGVDDAGRVLCVVVDARGRKRLALLVPQS